MGPNDRERTIYSCRDLRVWHAGMDLVEHVYRMTQSFPGHEIYGLTSQMRRAAVSIPSNIAEGRTREHVNEYLRHLSIVQGSRAELQTQIEIAGRLGYCSAEEADQALRQSAAVAMQLYNLRSALLKRRSSSTPEPLSDPDARNP